MEHAYIPMDENERYRYVRFLNKLTDEELARETRDLQATIDVAANGTDHLAAVHHHDYARAQRQTRDARLRNGGRPWWPAP